MKSKSSPKRNRRAKRQKKSLQFASLEPRQMLTFFTPGPSDPALFDTVLTVDSDIPFEGTPSFGERGSNAQINIVDGGRIGVDQFDSNFFIQGNFINAEVNITGGNLGSRFALDNFGIGEINISGGEVGDRFNTGIVANESSTINISGGVVGDNLSAFNTVINISGGEVGESLSGNGGIVNISGGTIGNGVFVSTGSLFNISGGQIGSLSVTGDSTLNISGGVFDNVSVSGVANISGGTIEGRFVAASDAEINLRVLEFQLDGVPQDSLAIGESVTITDPRTLSGLLSDGSTFNFEEAIFFSSSTVNVTLVDEAGFPNQAATIGGDLTASGLSDGPTVFSGQASISDPDLRDDRFIPQAVTRGAFGDFSLTPGGDWRFQVDTAVTSTLLLNQSISDAFEIISADGTTGSVTITITGVNQPVTASDTELDVLEDAVNGSNVGTVVANDPDGQATTISVVSGNEAGVFSVDAAGNVTVADASQLNFDVTPEFELVFEASDGLSTATATLTINVINVNQPVTASDTLLEVLEDAVNGSAVGTVIASDPDGDAPVISIVSGNDAGVFAIDNAGNVTVADASQLDFDITPEYVLVFEASDALTTATATLTISVIDVPNPAVIGGDITGSATEDRGTTGLLTISDADGADEEAFVAEFIRGTYGQIGIQADGNYRYTVSTDPVTQALRAGEIVVDTFTLTSVDGTTVDVTISIEGINDPATFPSTAPVQISEDATAPLTGQINVEDRDAGESEIVASQQIGSFGVFEINAAGQWSYTVDNAAANRTPAGQESNDVFIITSLDGTEQDFLVQVVGVNDAAVITGDTTGTIDEDALQSVSGVLAVADPDFNQSRLAPQEAVELGDFGTFQYNGLGRWFYTVDNEAVANLNATESVTDSFEVSSFDGSATVLVTITVEGRNDYSDDAVTTEAGTPVTFNVFDNDQVAGDVVVTSNLAAQGGDISIGANGEVTYTPSEDANLSGTDSFQLTFEDENGNIGRSNVSVTVNEAAPVEDIVVSGTTQDDFLEGNDLNNVLIGDRGSDILVGSRGNDVFITDAVNGNFNGNDRDIIRLGNVDGNDSGNDVVTDFDVNGTNGGENNFDALEFTFDGIDFSISTRNDIRRFVRFIETDGDVRTDAILDGNDLILVFGRDSEDPSIITSSVRLEDVVGQNGLTQRRLQRDSVDLLGTAELDVFFASGAVEIGSTASETLVGGAANDVIVGGAGSDTLFGGAGNDTLTGDQTDGGIFGSDQDTFAISEIALGNVGNDVITDFDVNNFDGGENNFDTLTLTLGNQDFSLSTGQDFLEFADFLDNDGNDDTGTLIDGDDIIFVFGRNDLGFITDSVRLKDVIGDDGLTNASLAAFNRVGESGRLDVFVV